MNIQCYVCTVQYPICVMYFWAAQKAVWGTCKGLGVSPTKVQEKYSGNGDGEKENDSWSLFPLTLRSKDHLLSHPSDQKPKERSKREVYTENKSVVVQFAISFYFVILTLKKCMEEDGARRRKINFLQ